MKVLIIDNYDSFTYNLVYLVQSIIKQEVDVIRNDQVVFSELEKYDKILLSPGPGVPDEAGKLKEVIAKFYKSKSILGVCLGLQAIAEVFGANLENINQVYHGLATPVKVIRKDKLFKNIPSSFLGGRYHSWIVSSKKLPECLQVSAVDTEQNIMALYHKKFDVSGVQFHPESILTECGEQIIKNWLFETDKTSIVLPSEGANGFDITNLSSRLLFC